jgi:hypothetical protein
MTNSVVGAPNDPVTNSRSAVRSSGSATAAGGVRVLAAGVASARALPPVEIVVTFTLESAPVRSAAKRVSRSDSSRARRRSASTNAASAWPPAASAARTRATLAFRSFASVAPAWKTMRTHVGIGEARPPVVELVTGCGELALRGGEIATSREPVGEVRTRLVALDALRRVEALEVAPELALGGREIAPLQRETSERKGDERFLRGPELSCRDRGLAQRSTRGIQVAGAHLDAGELRVQLLDVRPVADALRPGHHGGHLTPSERVITGGQTDEREERAREHRTAESCDASNARIA